jgi:N-glycosylase/DNA lyase
MKNYKITDYGVAAEDFDIRHTVESAQPLTFYADYNLAEGNMSYVSGKNLINVVWLGNSRNSKIRLISKDMNFAKREFVKRFALGDNMEKIYKEIATDGFVRASIEKYHGMRVTRNDPWETTLCFIMSQYNNVKRIRLIIRRFVSEFGEEILDDDGNVIAKSFPTSSDLLKFNETDFRRCGAGFRAKYLTKAVDYCTNNLDLYKLENKSYDKIKDELMQISGVGEKVADCIALMGYGKMEAFPIDVWVKRTMETFYFKGKTTNIKEIHKFAEKRWGNFRGYAQQYLFHSARNM